MFICLGFRTLPEWEEFLFFTSVQMMIRKSKIIKPFASWLSNKIIKDASNALFIQDEIRKKLLDTARHCSYAQMHDFSSIKNYNDFRNHVPLVTYEGLRPFIDRINRGEKNVLWPGKPIYYATTSGTTSGIKYIPITKESKANHFGTARNAVFHYISKYNRSSFLDGKMIFLSGSPELESHHGIKSGRLSGISNHLIPGWLKSNQLPSYTTNCMEDWESKLDRIVQETAGQNMTMISGIPPWVKMYFEKLLDYTGKPTIKDIFPDFSLFVYGGVNFKPYRSALFEMIGEKIDTLETYPASEGFIAFQDIQDEEGLLLNVNSGIFFEFIDMDTFYSENKQRIHLEEIELDKNYALVLNSNAGLWAYLIGDTIKFISKDPYRILVTGRIDHFISAFGEHVIAQEVEKAMYDVALKHQFNIIEFTVAPQVHPENGALPHHEWFIEFEEEPNDLEQFARDLDLSMQKQNIYYSDLIKGKVLQTLKISKLSRTSFRAYMKSIGKLGGQNKVPRLSDNRKIADQLSKYIIN